MESYLDWKGLYPNRFSPGRLHLKTQDQLNVNGEIGGPLPIHGGRKHF